MILQILCSGFWMTGVQFANLSVDLPYAIVPFYDGIHLSKVYTSRGNFLSKLSVGELVDNYCMVFGSSLQGRIHATRKKLGFKKNPPILVTPLGHVGIQVPTICRKEIIWVLRLDFKIVKHDSQGCVLVFDDNFELHVPLGKSALDSKKARGYDVLMAFTQNAHVDSHEEMDE